MKRNRLPFLAALLASALVALLACAAGAELLQRRPANAPAAAGNVNLPYTVADGSGNQWRIYQGGWLQQSGNMPLYSQGSMLMVNGAQPNMANNMARMDNETGEVVFENLQATGYSVTRRVLVDRELGFVRYIDVIKNNTGQEQTVGLQISSNFNYGLQNGQSVPDPRRKGQDVGWVGQTHANGMCVIEVYAGKGSKIGANRSTGRRTTTSRWPPSRCRSSRARRWRSCTCTAPPPASTPACRRSTTSRKRTCSRASPASSARSSSTSPPTQSFVTDVEILRGELLDVVELKTGDQFKGTLKEQTFALDTFYGPVELPGGQGGRADQRGQLPPAAARDHRRRADLRRHAQEADGRPAAVQRAGHADPAGAGAARRLPQARRASRRSGRSTSRMVLMRSGERIGVKMPTAPIEAVDAVRESDAQARDRGGDRAASRRSTASTRFYLTDGSKFAGLLDRRPARTWSSTRRRRRQGSRR